MMTSTAAIRAPARRTSAWRRLAARIDWPLLVLVLLGVALRLWFISASSLDPRFSTADDGDYYRRALRFAVTGQYLDDSWLIRPPLHVFFFAFWLRAALLFGSPTLGVLLVQLAQVGLGALSIVLAYGCAQQLFANRRAGLLFAAFQAVWYPFVEQPSVLFSELLYLTLFALHFWLLLRFDANRRWRDLALAGAALGASALTRSPALYSIAFVGLWLLVRGWMNREKGAQLRDHRGQWLVVGGQIALFLACTLAVVLPWTARNYMLYRHIIPVDTLGQTNLWLDLDSVDQREAHINALRALPQADRAGYAMAQARAILAADPLRPFRPMWDTFRHIWKAQFVEDYFLKRSFFTRPLRETAALGLPGDLLWFVFTIAGLIGLARSPSRTGRARGEGWHNRLFVLAWLGYSFFTVLLFHVEPRYLLPIWWWLGLYGAWALADLPMLRTIGPGARNDGKKIVQYLLQGVLVIAFLALFFSYRDYPSMIASGAARERGMIAGDQAYARNDYAAAEQAYRAALAAQPDFIDGHTSLALALAAQGHNTEARAQLRPNQSRRSDLVLGALARDAGDLDAARAPLGSAENRAGEDIQRWALAWLRPPATNSLHLSKGFDLGYIDGFSGGEEGPAGTFRWLSGAGQVHLPLRTPLTPASNVFLRLTSGRPSAVPLDVWAGDYWLGQALVSSGEWREYRFALPPELAGTTTLELRLRAPTFVPAREDPASDDARMLSLMISQVRVQ